MSSYCLKEHSVQQQKSEEAERIYCLLFEELMIWDVEPRNAQAC